MEEAPVPPLTLPFIVIAYKHNDGELIKCAGGNGDDVRTRDLLDALKHLHLHPYYPHSLLHTFFFLLMVLLVSNYFV